MNAVQQNIFSTLPEPKTGPRLYAILSQYITGDYCNSKTARDLGWGIYFVTDKDRAEFLRCVFPLPLSLAKLLYSPKYITGGYEKGSSIFTELPRDKWIRKSRRSEMSDDNEGHSDWRIDDMWNLAKLIMSKGKL